MDRDVLSEEQWERIGSGLPRKPGDPGRSGADNRLFVAAALWRVRAGAPWRDAPCFRKWGTVYNHFRRCAEKGVFGRVLAALSDEPDFECPLVEGTIVKVHRHDAGARRALTLRPSAGRAVA